MSKSERVPLALALPLAPSSWYNRNMIKILTAAQMREVDRLTVERYGVSLLIMMENAGREVYAALEKEHADLRSRRIAIVCGKGNNGGDAMVAARQLILRGIQPDIYLLARKEEVKGEARTNLEILEAMHCPVREVTTLEEWQQVAARLGRYDILVDGLLGTGLNKPVSGLYEAAIKSINAEPRLEVVAVDLPSGLSSDSGELIGEAVSADLTVALTAPKLAHIFAPACERVGRLMIAPIGTPPELLESEELYLNLVTAKDVQQELRPRPRLSHKGDYGHILVVSGSVGKTGAAAMTGMGALRQGAGLVTVATARSALATVAGYFYELMTEPLDETAEGAISEKALERALALAASRDVLAVGPGLGTDQSTVNFVRRLISQSPVPVVIDADAINAFVGSLELLANRHGMPLVITPHPGELARLVGLSTGEVISNRIALVRKLARERALYVVLKGFRTLVGDPAGNVYVVPTGGPALATGGTGDVLTGMIAAMIVDRSRGRERKNYARAIATAVYLHGLAGDLAAKSKGEEAVVAGDVLACISEAIAEAQRATG